MNNTKYFLKITGLFCLLGMPFLTLACASAAESSNPSIAGATAWQQQCIRCHEYRTPSAYNDSEWETTLLHMRTRANLPAEDAQAILEFMKSAN